MYCEGTVGILDENDRQAAIYRDPSTSTHVAALVPCLPDLLANALYNHLPHQVKRERHYKVYTRTSA